MIAIVESKDLLTIRKGELQGSLKVHEQHMNERVFKKSKSKVALQAQFNNKDKKVKGKWASNKGRGNYHNSNGRDSQGEFKAKIARQEDDDDFFMLMLTTKRSF